MTDVSYQTFLTDVGRLGAERFVPLPPGALATRRKDADRKLTVRVSKQQARWLEHIEGITGKGIDTDAVIRALIDLGRELDVDWAMLASAGALREAVAEAVRVRQAAGAG
jgi:hypothetical protein